MSAIDIYDFEGIIPAALKAVFQDAQLNAFTMRDDPVYRNTRPRVEIVYVHGTGAGQHVVPNAKAGTPMTYENRRESAWRGQLKLDAVSNAGNLAQHGAYVSTVRALMATIWTLVNGVYLKFHKLQFAGDGGCSPLQEPTKGVVSNTLLYDTYISMSANAWERLLDPNPMTPATP